MIPNTDATPSWSGYIFQGEVALCRTIELINTLGDNIPDNYCLRLEMDEDFSLKTTDIDVFQVKAYLSKDCDKISKYAETIQELINKYYYFSTRRKDPDDGRKTIKTYSVGKRRKPLKSYLITDKRINDFDNTLASFDRRYNSIAPDSFHLIHGEYTLSNISAKLSDAIRTLLNNPNSTEDDIINKRNYCCNLIFDKVKERHQSHRAESIPLNTIKRWILEAPNALTLNVCWYNIYKIFMNSLSHGLEHFDLEDESDVKRYEVLTNAIAEIEKIAFDDFIKIIDQFLLPHRELDKNNLLYSFGRYIDGDVVRNVIVRAIKEIELAPAFATLQYYKEVAGVPARYQLLIHNEEYNERDGSEKALFQKHCEKIHSQPNTKDIDFFITQTLDKDRESIRERLHTIIGGTTDSILGVADQKAFGFKSIASTITELNQ